MSDSAVVKISAEVSSVRRTRAKNGGFFPVRTAYRKSCPAKQSVPMHGKRTLRRGVCGVISKQISRTPNGEPQTHKSFSLSDVEKKSLNSTARLFFKSEQKLRDSGACSMKNCFCSMAVLTLVVSTASSFPSRKCKTYRHR